MWAMEVDRHGNVIRYIKVDSPIPYCGGCSCLNLNGKIYRIIATLQDAFIVRPLSPASSSLSSGPLAGGSPPAFPKEL